MKTAKRFLFVFLGCFFAQFNGFSQGEPEEEYTKEFTYGLMMATNGGIPSGLSFRYAKIVAPRLNNFYAVEFVGIRHPKEVRVTYVGGNSFTSNKLNYFYSLRFSYGKDAILFKKASQEGVQVNLQISGGPSLGLIKPYMVIHKLQNGRTEEVPNSVNFNQSTEVLGAGSWFNGWGRTELALGVHAKVATSFEISAFRSNLTGIELGIVGDLFYKTIPIMGNPTGIQNYQLFSAAYLNFFFGNRK